MTVITRPITVKGKPSHIAVMVATPDEAQTLIDAIDALHRENPRWNRPGDFKAIRAALVEAAYRRVQ